MPATELSYLLVGESSQGRGSDEREEALIHHKGEGFANNG